MVQVAVPVLLVTVPEHGRPASPVAVTVFVYEPGALLNVQLQLAEAPGARLPIAAGLQRLPVTTTLSMVTVPQFVTVPEKVMGAPHGEGGVQVSVIERHVTLQVHVFVAAFELTAVLHGAPAVPLACAVLLMSPPVVQSAVQLQGAEAPAASVPTFTLPHAVFVTTIPVTVTVPVFVTVPEKVMPVPPEQPFVHDWVMERLVVLHVQVFVAVFELTAVLHGAPAVPDA